MYRTLLVPLDGSAFGEYALPLALNLARQTGAAIRLLHVHAPVVYVEGLVSLDNALDQRAREQETAYLAKMARQLEGSLGKTVSTVLVDGPVADALVEHAAATETGLIVMTTHGRGPFSRFWLGSVADQLLRRATVPLLLVRPPEQVRADDAAGTDITRSLEWRHVLVPLDGSPLAEQVLPVATELTRPSKASYTLLRVVQPPHAHAYDHAAVRVSGPDSPLLEQMQSEAWSSLERVAERLRGQGLQVETRVLIDAQPAVAILDLATARTSSLIALATHGRRGLDRLLLGSIADKVVRGSQVPVLVVRPTWKEKNGG
jgi:nucleotide-binding universal stress UspA family protein